MLAWPSFRADSAVASRSLEPCCARAVPLFWTSPLPAWMRDATAKAVIDFLDGRMLLLATHDVADAQALDISDIITL